MDGKTMLAHAYEHQYGIGAFSAQNAEMIKGIIEAAEEEQSPVMIQIGQKAINHLGLLPLKEMVAQLARDATIPIAVHLDHSRSYQQAMQAIQANFQSVMFDGSALPFNENAYWTRQVVMAGHALGIGVEGEIGKIGGTEDDISISDSEATITKTEEAMKFVEETNVDYLAVSIGTAHGLYTAEPHIRMTRLKEIVAAVNRPIVLHGGSGVPDVQVQEAIKNGVAKINVDTELRKAFSSGMQHAWHDQADNYVVADVLQQGIDEMKKVVKQKIRVFGSQKQIST
ncbi:class II fructose-bisphosphate aldolase [Litoribacterium kuwaitense]|uniref:class II fructose-bisphosphate aldolase n=1 Tax=Litoribacterium kuwaitense TaxID=1398745 RepID=UPI001FEBAF6E|nr:class II fructose-bisphosphate aldolase [Litoribacterium kuwaitense]